ncbi:high affinity cGMP-specific 3',5'-cyclic phosphodiesterase 9A-like [Actinia tenebrosa]|uniref:Phosphodiesterase n=1 Tax=Actinia tenebrosa TaxID=6105 RepID=A0A6P8J9V8_ACTTE|nr:high affinity cGMP-specific 3',5'-cyclic phosphodiesterase 9A-like [Actinia tenebrosa]XP_031574523.1 high affinity cGMP-specific 3',5'-cyclic phosphodiesterase 9A-like [Actinia tenebrosa]
MAAKVIYFKVGEKDEQAEFGPDVPTEDIKELFRCAAEASPYDILKLYNTKGNLVNISSKLQENSPETRYRLDTVATSCTACGICETGQKLEALEKRLENLEREILIENGETPSVVKDIKSKVDSFRDKLESVEHLSWLGLFKEMSSGTRRSGTAKPILARKTSEEFQNVFKKFKKLSTAELSEETRNILKKPTFDNWQWEEEEMLYLLQQMYVDLGLLDSFNIERSTLQYFLYEVYRHYNPAPFHNFRHAFCVTQMMYGLIWMTDISSKIEPHEILIMLTSALCHDLDHPGYNNAYQINARTELALRYNDLSPLENHHCAVAFDIMSQNESNILKNVSPEMFKKMREGMIKCILATDMARHSEILKNFKEMLKSGFKFDNEGHKLMLMQIMIKVSDVSNEARPMDVAEPWLDCLLQEFFTQSDVEKMEGLPVAPFMDRNKVTKPSAQIGFIKFVLIPLFEALGELFPILEEHLISPVRKALSYYVDMGQTMEKELKKKNSREENDKQQVVDHIRKERDKETAILINGRTNNKS